MGNPLETPSQRRRASAVGDVFPRRNKRMQAHRKSGESSQSTRRCSSTEFSPKVAARASEPMIIFQRDGGDGVRKVGADGVKPRQAGILDRKLRAAKGHTHELADLRPTGNRHRSFPSRSKTRLVPVLELVNVFHGIGRRSATAH